MNQHQEPNQRETVHDKFVVFVFWQNWGGKKSQKGEQNTCVYVSGICAEGISVSFPW